MHAHTHEVVHMLQMYVHAHMIAHIPFTCHPLDYSTHPKHTAVYLERATRCAILLFISMCG